MYFVFCSTIFLNSALLFVIQPMVAKMILPYLGGTPAVWNTSLFFFQGFLLAGYVYAHLGSGWLGTRRHAAIHLALLLGAAFALPVAVSSEWFTSADLQPAKTVLSVLFVAVGPPFFVLSAGAPLLQKWFATSSHTDAGDPYFLYAASNLGSLAGLAVYPLWLEPYFGLAQQSRVWFYGYLALVFLSSTCVFLLVRSYRPAAEVNRVGSESSPPTSSAIRWTANGRIGFREARWVLLSFAPSSLLLGVTTYVTTDIASAPLFWIVPLALYLLSFVIGFSRHAGAVHSMFVSRQPFLLTAAAVTFFAKATSPAWLLLPLHLLAFSVTALVCHGELAKDRPPPNRLTEFYVWISLGGVLGGCFNALLAPALFNGVEEYPLGMIVAALMRPHLDHSRRARLGQWLDVLLPCGVGLLTWPLLAGSQQHALLSPRATHLLIFGASGIFCLASARRPLRFALSIATVMFVSSLYTGPFGTTVHSERSFFGVYKAMQNREKTAHILFHGSTVHGIQNLDPGKRLQPSSYFHPSGPAGQVFRIFAHNRPKGRIAIVGLGVGSLACHAQPEQSVTFYEIDPLVERIARNPELFTFLRDCPPLINVEIGDARISLGKTRTRQYDLFVLDAFSSDAIPIHLLTREAIEVYLSRLKNDGLLLFHISNRYFDLSSVLGEAAASLKLVALIQDDSVLSDVEARDGKVASRWIVMARAPELLSSFLQDSRWQRLDGRYQGALWSDDYSNILRAFRWN